MATERNLYNMIVNGIRVICHSPIAWLIEEF